MRTTKEPKSEVHKKFEEVLGDEISEYELCQNWTVGGITGGDCWGSSANIAVTAESEPELLILDRILEKACPNIPLMKYRKLEKEEGLIKYEDYSTGGYYGNYYEKRKKTLNLDVLYKFLVENNLWN